MSDKWTKSVEWTPDLWRLKAAERGERKVSMEVEREFDAGMRYAKWKVGERKEMFVRFVHHDRRELAG